MQTTASSIAGAPLPRAPLVSDETLRQHDCLLQTDTRFRRAARLLQHLWLRDHGIATGVHVRGHGAGTITTNLGSILDPAAARAGLNFLTPAIHRLVRHELLMREEGAAIDEDRLFGNALSSMPLLFNVFGPMVLDLDLATAVFRQMLPEFVHQVTGFAFEHSPGRRQGRFLNDGTAFDLAVRVVTPDGEDATVLIELKYSEGMDGPAARLRDRYDEVSRAAGLFVNPDGALLRTLALEQFWREHMLAQLMVDQGITPRAMFVAIGPRLNRRAMAACRVYESELIPGDDQDANRIRFQGLTLEAVIEALATAGAESIASELWRRYLDFERIYRVSMEFVESDSGDGNPSSLPAPEPAAIPGGTESKRKTTRKVVGSVAANRRRTKASADVTPMVAP
ncbi:MAG: PGN_0703 family putative restriction endonuclease [Afipia sp.]